jgi:hypothetical protein
VLAGSFCRRLILDPLLLELPTQEVRQMLLDVSHTCCARLSQEAAVLYGRQVWTHSPWTRCGSNRCVSTERQSAAEISCTSIVQKGFATDFNQKVVQKWSVKYKPYIEQQLWQSGDPVPSGYQRVEQCSEDSHSDVWRLQARKDHEKKSVTSNQKPMLPVRTARR